MTDAARTFGLILLLLSACTLARSEVSTPWPTATTIRVPRASPVPSPSRDFRPVASLQPADSPPLDECQPDSSPVPSRYSVVADVNYASHTIKVAQAIRYQNSSEDELRQLVLVVEPNRWPGAFLLDSVVVNDESPAYELTGQRLTVELPEPLQPGCWLKLEVQFRLAVPAIGEGLEAYHGFFGYSSRQLNLGYWLPTVAARIDGAWIVRESVFIGEQNVLESADWDVTLSVVAASSSLRVAAPGEVTHLTDTSWRFVLTGARDFPISLSEQFKVASQLTTDGIKVELYSFDDALVVSDGGSVHDGATYALTEATRSLTAFSDLFGEFPYRRMVVVEGDFPDGMEFSGLVFVSGDWFHRYEGTPTDYLTVITVHEVAHQWWYARVGNDAAMYPWLDEALATYSEYIFIEEYYPDLKDWWWQWRVERYSPIGNVDSSVYDFVTIREYINAVYLRGAKMLHQLRQDIGTQAFFDLLRNYAASETGRIATPERFWSLLTPEQLQQTQVTRHRYLLQPQTGRTAS